MRHDARVGSVLLGVVAGLMTLWGCATSPPETGAVLQAGDNEGAVDAELADVVSVQVSGQPGAYQFAVEIASPDTGCDQYADWWEVVGEGGELIYRRILTHSHVDEQPFTRSGGPVAIEAGTVVWVRAHMHPGGYGRVALKGSVQAGFQGAELDSAFASSLAEQPPLPSGCAF